MKELNFIIKNHRYKVFLIVIYSMLLMAIGVFISPFFLQKLIDEGIKNKNFEFFIYFSGIMIVIASLFHLCNTWVILIIRKFKNKLISEQSKIFYQSYFRIPYFNTLKKESGYYASIIYDEVKNSVNMVIDFINGIFSSLVGFITSFLICLYFSWKITLVLLIIVPLLFFISKFFTKKISHESEQEKLQEANIREDVQKNLKAYKIINIYDLKEVSQKDYENKLIKYFKVFYKRFKLESIFMMISGLLSAYQESIIIIVTGYQVINGDMSIGEFVAYSRTFYGIIGYFNKLNSYIPEFAKLKGYIKRLMEYENYCRSDERALIDNNLQKEEYMIQNLTFGYDSKSLLFDNSNFTFPRKKSSLLVGANGTGKTTLINLLIGFLKPSLGTVNSEKLAKVSVTYSSTDFYNGSLLKNVDYDKLDNNKRKIFEELIVAFELKGYIDEIPSLLSTGQQKRFAIIMALLKTSELYIFDEPFANLDKDIIEVVISKIKKYTLGKTVIYIMHEEEKYKNLVENIIYV